MTHSSRDAGPALVPAAGRPDVALSMPQVAAILARDIADGSYVNLGIGLPTLVQAQLPEDREIVLQSENGILGMGPPPAIGQEDRDLVNAGKQRTTLVPGAVLFDSAASFAMIRGGHIDIAVLGAFEVSVDGDLANWTLGDADALPSVGGAMDLAASGARIHVIMPLFSKHGECKLVRSCRFPLTAPGCVERVYTDYATFALEDGRARVLQAHGDLDLFALAQLTNLELVA